MAIKELMTARHTVSLVDRHVAAIRKVCKTCCNGFLLKHLQHLVELLQLTIQRFSQGLIEFAPAICDFTRVASQPLVSCRASDMITYGHHLPAFIKVLVSVLQHSLPPEEEAPSGGDQAEALRIFEERRALFERIRIEVAHTLACWSRFGLDEDSVEPQPDQPLIQAVADAGTPNLRILRHSQVIDALSASFRNEDSPEAIVITLGAIRDMSLYRPLAKQITNCGLISNLVHVVRVNLLGSDVLLVAAEVLWNVLELDFDGAAEALGQADIIEAFRDFMDAALTRGYRFKDKIFRNDMMVLLMYAAKRVENRALFASTGLMALLLSQAVSDSQRQELIERGTLDELLASAGAKLGAWPPGAPQPSHGNCKGPFVMLTNSQEDMEFRMLLWGTLSKCCSAEECAHVATRCGLVPSLLEHLDPDVEPPDHRLWSMEQRRRVQLEVLSALFHLVQYVPETFLQAQGNDVVLRLLQATRSREVQKKCLTVMQVSLRMGDQFREELGRLGAVGLLVEFFADRDNPMGARQLCASVIAGLCRDHPGNVREFRKKDGVETIRAEVAYRPDETADNHLFYTLSVIDCVWCAVVGTRKNEARFLDAGGLFALLDVLEVAPMLLKRQIMGCLADIMQYRKAARLFAQWNSQVTMKGALKILLELWQQEQDAYGSSSPDGVMRDADRPLRPVISATTPEGGEAAEGASDAGSVRSSRVSGRIRHARTFGAGFGAATGGKASAATGAAPKAVTVDSIDPTTTRGHGLGGATAVSGGLQKALSDRQDCRAKIYSVLLRADFQCQEALGIAERQQMEMVKLYPDAMQLESWIEVKENLAERNVKPVAADRKWIEDSILELREESVIVQERQRTFAQAKLGEEEASLRRFYDDVRGRAAFKRVTTAKEASRGGPGTGGLDGAGYPTRGSLQPPPGNPGGASSGDESP